MLTLTLFVLLFSLLCVFFNEPHNELEVAITEDAWDELEEHCQYEDEMNSTVYLYPNTIEYLSELLCNM